MFGGDGIELEAKPIWTRGRTPKTPNGKSPVFSITLMPAENDDALYGEGLIHRRCIRYYDRNSTVTVRTRLYIYIYLRDYIRCYTAYCQ